MPRTAKQLNIRSTLAYERVHAIAARTGRTATQVVEDIVLAYDRGNVSPPSWSDRIGNPGDTPPAGLRWEGGILVGSGRGRVTHEEIQASIDDGRNGMRD